LNVTDRRELIANRGFLDRRRHQIRGQGHVSRFQVVALDLGLGGERFDLPPIAAEHVRVVGNGGLGRMKVVEQGLVVDGALRVLDGLNHRPVALHARRDAVGEVPRDFLPLEVVIQPDGGKEESALRRRHLLGLAQRRLRIADARVLLEGQFDQRIQPRRLKQRPPLPADVRGRIEMLRLAARRRRVGRFQRQGRGAVARILRGSGPVKIGSDAGGRQEGRREHRHARRTPRRPRHGTACRGIGAARACSACRIHHASPGSDRSPV
jgi:hypothetical protein